MAIQGEPYQLIRGYDTCSRSSCGHQRRWHAPCTARLGEQDQLGQCGCPAFLDVATVQQQAQATQEQAQVTAAGLNATQAELDSHEAQPDHKAPKVTPLMAEPQVLAPDGSVVTPGPDVAQEEDTPGAAVAATMAAPPPDAAPGPDVAQDTAPAPGPVKRAARTPRAQPRRVKGR